MTMGILAARWVLAKLLRKSVALMSRSVRSTTMQSNGLRCAASSASFPLPTHVITHRDYVHRDVPGNGIVLQQIQHRPAVHVRQQQIQRDRVRRELLHERQGRAGIRSDHPFESALARNVEERGCKLEVVFHDQDHIITLPDLATVIAYRRLRAWRRSR